MGSCSGPQRISTPIPSPSASDLGVPSIVPQSFVTASSLCPGILPFPKCFLRGTTGFSAGLGCAVPRVWQKADSALLPQRPPLQPPTASNCMSTHSTVSDLRRSKIKIQWLLLKFENQRYDIKILSLLIICAKCTQQSKFQLPMSHCFHPGLATTCTTGLKPLQNLKNRNHIFMEDKVKN